MINRLRGPGTLTPFTLTWTPSFGPEGSDRDLLDIMNLIWPDARYEVPVVTYHARAPSQCRSVHIVEVSGSFIFRLNEALAAIPCPPRIDLWWYWGTKYFRYPGGGTGAPLPVDPRERRRSLLGKVDVVILEENDGGIPQTPEGNDLLAFVKSQRAAAVATR